MPNTKLSALVAAGALTGAELFYSDDGTNDVKVTATQLQTFAATNPNSLTARSATAIPAGGTAGQGVLVSSTANFGIFFGSGAPTLSAAKGSLYLRSDGASNVTRAYINTDGGTTWTAINTVA